MHYPVTFVNFVDKANQWLYRVTAGRVGGQLLKYPMLLLHTVGRKSGQLRTHTLLYIKDGENMLICASNNGQEHFPGWYWNLKHDQHAQVQVGPRHYEVLAIEASGEEYERLWKKFLAMTSLYKDHRKRTKRRFPILILQPVREIEQASS